MAACRSRATVACTCADGWALGGTRAVCRAAPRREPEDPCSCLVRDLARVGVVDPGADGANVLAVPRCARCGAAPRLRRLCSVSTPAPTPDAFCSLQLASRLNVGLTSIAAAASRHPRRAAVHVAHRQRARPSGRRALHTEVCLATMARRRAVPRLCQGVLRDAAQRASFQHERYLWSLALYDWECTFTPMHGSTCSPGIQTSAIFAGGANVHAPLEPARYHFPTTPCCAVCVWTAGAARSPASEWKQEGCASRGADARGRLAGEAWPAGRVRGALELPKPCANGRVARTRGTSPSRLRRQACGV
eukprot:350196-Chlamydomonas_euryale.AAC.2